MLNHLHIVCIIDIVLKFYYFYTKVSQKDLKNCKRIKKSQICCHNCEKITIIFENISPLIIEIKKVIKILHV